ncbi:hypothetical protein VI08_09095 [Luteibacter yeojuensis]|uniref:Uncharacterized protein n=1 Tax=Luteibacter yeojuensis TaxID=345309 RepID=A0A0F3KU51_9GAMM|nr:hypothetical protein VI08_09095 [Luteibacter yeojuensis]
MLRLLESLRGEGSGSLRSQAERVGLPVGALRNFLAGFPIPDDIARDIEWTMHLPEGWLDGSPVEPQERSGMAPPRAVSSLTAPNGSAPPK